MSREVIRTANLAQDGAALILQEARTALADRNEFRVALSGGDTPRPIYAELARKGSDLPWDRMQITFGDERCVPPDDDQSNFRMANETLFQPASIPEKSIARMRGEIEPRLAAQEYQDQLDLLATQRGEQIYRHDLILLGLGPDGHTASLFPGTKALDEKIDRVVANFVPKLSAWRITFTFSLLSQARRICFIVNAEKNQDLIERVLQGDQKYPAAQVEAKAQGDVTWILGQQV